MHALDFLYFCSRYSSILKRVSGYLLKSVYDGMSATQTRPRFILSSEPSQHVFTSVQHWQQGKMSFALQKRISDMLNYDYTSDIMCFLSIQDDVNLYMPCLEHVYN